MSGTGLPENGTPAGGVPVTENRRDPRFTLLFRAAKLVAPNGEYLCIMRDASASGVRVQLFHAMPPYQHVILEMPSGDRHGMTMVWERNDHAGFYFDQRVDVARLIGDAGPYPKRPVRLSIDWPVTVYNQGVPVAAMLRNLSQQGVRIDCPAHLALDQIVRIDAEGLPELRARVRWRKDKAYGLVLDRTFRFEELAQRVWMLHQANELAAASPPPMPGERFA